MKTIEEFIQRLQNDPEFEQQAQAYENSDEFMNFVKSEGYDFSLDQLLDKFNHEDEGTDQSVAPSPVSTKSVEEFIQRLQEDPEFEHQAQAFENDAAFMEFVRNEGYDFTLDQLTDGFKQGMGLLQPQDQKPPTSLKAVEMPLPRPPDSAELGQQSAPSPSSEKGQKRPGISPKLEGVVGGRRRGMKWRETDG